MDNIHIPAKQDAPVYNTPLRFRKMENLHILFWLLKDISWCMTWKALGIAMIFPTLAVAILISWRTRHMISELAHNLAIVVWIIANSFWMISEFFNFDEKIFYAGVNYKYLAVIPFVTGILILAWYYLWYATRNRSQQQTGYL